LKEFLVNYPDRITFNIWSEKFAFPLKDYPKKANKVSLNDKYPISRIVRDEFD